MTSLLVTHSFNDISHVCDKVLFLIDNSLLGPFDITEIVKNPIRYRIAKLIGLNNVFENKLSNDIKTAYNLNKKHLFIPLEAMTTISTQTTVLVNKKNIVINNSEIYYSFDFFNQPILISASICEKSQEQYIDLKKIISIDE